MIPGAYLRPRAATAIALVLMAIGLVWSVRHVYGITDLSEAQGNSFTLLWAMVFGSLLFHLVLAWTNKPFTVKDEAEQVGLDALRVTVAVPAYNEDPAALALALRSVFEQTRRPQRIHVVDDGSSADLSEAKAAFEELAQAYPDVETVWTRTPNRGKRHAQIEVFEADPHADIYATMDSDTVLDAKCIENGLHPFAQRDITSVASVILAYNNRHWFVRITDSWLLAFQMVVRAAMSRLGCVLVNSGNFSMYRAQVVRDALPSYGAETFRGNTVMFSDDSLLTLFAHLKGRTIQQENSFAFTVLPENVGHHVRQQIRWMRGSTIRSVWRFRYLPVKGWAYWEHFAAWVNFALITVAFVVLMVILPLLYQTFHAYLLLFSVLICYITAVRYMVVGRTDQSWLYQVGTVALAPVMLAWTALILRPLRLYSIATCFRTGWGTRAKGVEVSGVEGSGVQDDRTAEADARVASAV